MQAKKDLETQKNLFAASAYMKNSSNWKLNESPVFFGPYVWQTLGLVHEFHMLLHMMIPQNIVILPLNMIFVGSKKNLHHQIFIKTLL